MMMMMMMINITNYRKVAIAMHCNLRPPERPDVVPVVLSLTRPIMHQCVQSGNGRLSY